MPRLAPSQTGLLLLLAGSAVDSTSGLFTRLIAADGFTTAAGRGFSAFVFLFALLVLRDRGRVGLSLLAVGLWGAMFVGLNGVGMVLTILSLNNTAVANFFMIFATAPFIAAIAARVTLGESLDLATMLAAAAGIVGIAVMMFAGARSGGLMGDLLALASVGCYCANILILRRYPAMDILPVSTLTVLLSGVLAMPFATFAEVTARDGGLLVLFGVLQLAMANLLVFSAASRIPAAQSGLLGILNAGFAPLWVFAFLGEVPPPATLVGGAIILSAAIAHLIWTMRQSRIPAPLRRVSP